MNDNVKQVAAVNGDVKQVAAQHIHHYLLEAVTQLKAVGIKHAIIVAGFEAALDELRENPPRKLTVDTVVTIGGKPLEF